MDIGKFLLEPGTAMMLDAKEKGASTLSAMTDPADIFKDVGLRQGSIYDAHNAKVAEEEKQAGFNAVRDRLKAQSAGVGLKAGGVVRGWGKARGAKKCKVR